MSLIVDGVWKAGVWATTVWADGVWFETTPVPVTTTTGGGPDATFYYRLKRKRQQREKAKAFDAASRAARAYEIAKAAAPYQAEEIVAPFKVSKPASVRYEINWPALVEHVVILERLVALQQIAEQEAEDEAILLLLETVH